MHVITIALPEGGCRRFAVAPPDPVAAGHGIAVYRRANVAGYVAVQPARSHLGLGASADAALADLCGQYPPDDLIRACRDYDDTICPSPVE